MRSILNPNSKGHTPLFDMSASQKKKHCVSPQVLNITSSKRPPSWRRRDICFFLVSWQFMSKPFHLPTLHKIAPIPQSKNCGGMGHTRSDPTCSMRPRLSHSLNGVPGLPISTQTKTTLLLLSSFVPDVMNPGHMQTGPCHGWTIPYPSWDQPSPR